MSVKVTVLDAQQALSTHQAVKGDVLVLQAQSNVNYQLTDVQTGFGPQNILTKRQGDNLVIMLDDGNTEADIIIENYYDQTGAKITGLHENGNLYAYVPQSGEVANSISLLAEEVIASQALGGTELAVPFWAFDPWWVAGGVAAVAGVAGVVAAAGGSSGGNAVVDDGSANIAKAEDLLKKISELEAKYTEALKDAKSDIIISTEEVGEASTEGSLAGLAAQLATAKQEALNALNSVPNSNGAKGALLEKVQAVVVPTPHTNDADNDGTVDVNGENSEVSNIESLLAGATALQTRAQGLLDSLEQAGVPVTQKNQDDVIAFNNSLKAQLENIEKALSELPESLEIIDGTEQTLAEKKAELTELFKKLQPVQVPAVTDLNNDGKEASVEELLEAAQKASQEVEKLKESANGVISEETAQKIQKATEKAELAKKAVEQVAQKQKESGDLTEEQRAELDKQIEQAKDISVAEAPKVNDLNNDGVPDEQQLEQARKAVDDAKDATDKAQKKLDEITLKGLVTPADLEELQKLNKDAEEAQKTAKEALENLPKGWEKENSDANDTTSPSLSELANSLRPVEEPAVTANDQGEPLSANELVEQAKKAEEKAEEALKALEQKGYVSKEDVAEIEKLNKAVESAKKVAEEALNKLDEGDEQKQGLTESLVQVSGVEVPEEKQAPQVSDAEDLLKRAREAEKEFYEELNQQAQAEADENLKKATEAKDGAEKALAQAEGDKAQAEQAQKQAEADKAQAEQAKTQADDAKTKAEEAKAQAEEVLKQAQQAVDNGDNSADAQQALANAQQAVEEAEQAKKQAEEAKEQAERAIAKAEGDKAKAEEAQKQAEQAQKQAQEELEKATDAEKVAQQNKADTETLIAAGQIPPFVSQETANALKQKQSEVESLKTEAQKKINEIPDEEAKEKLTEQLPEIKAVIPPVTDFDGDGVSDDDVLSAVKGKLDLAEQAEREFEQKLAELQGEGKALTTEEQEALQPLKEKVEALKADAQKAVEELKDKVADKSAQEALKARLDEIQAEIPAANDKDSDGISDETEAEAQKQAETALNDIQSKLDEYATKLANAGEAISAGDKDILTEAKEDIEEAIKQAEAKIDALSAQIGTTESDKQTIAKLKEQVDAFKKQIPTVPTVNDQDSDNIIDSKEEDALTKLDKAFDDVREAIENYQTALATAQGGDGAIDASEVEGLQKALKAVVDAKAEAEKQINDLPNTIGNALVDQKFQAAKLKELGALPLLPELSDIDNDGITDTEEAKTLATLGLKDAAATDANASKSKVQLAEEAKQAYEDYLTKAQQAGGDAPNDKATLNAEELEKLAELKSDLDAKLKSAEDAVEGLAGKLGGSDVDTNTTEKGLKDRLEALKTVSEIPEGAKDADNDGKTDADEKALVDAFINGTDDANDAEVGLEAVKKARDEYQRALDSARDATGTNKPTITPTEAKALADAKKALDKAIEDAEAKLDDLKAELGNTDADSKKVAELKALLDAQKVAEADVPKADDADNDGITDTEEAKTLATLGLKDAAATDANASKSKVQLAEEAKQAYEDYLTKAQQAGGDAPNDKATLNAEELEKLAELKSDLDAKLKSAEDAVEGLAGKLGGSDVDTNTTEKGLKDRLEALKTVSEIPEGAKDADNDGKTDADEKALVDAFINGTDDANDAEVGLEAVKKARDEYQRALDSARDATGTNKPTITPTEAKALADAKKALDKAIEDAEAKLDDLKAELGNTDADSKKVAELKALLDAQKVAEADVPKADDADNDGITDTEEAKTLATLGLKDAAATDANASKSKVQLAEEAKQAYEDYLTKAQQAGGDAPNDKATLNAEELEKLAELKSDLDAKLKSAEDAVEGLAGKLGGSDVDTNTTEKGLKDRLEALKTVSEIPEGAKDADNDGKTDADEKALVDAFINGTDDANDAEVGLEAVKKARDEYQRALDSARDATGTNKPTITPTEAKALADAKKALDKAIEDAEAKLDDLKAELGNTDADSKKVAELKALLDAQKVAEADVPKADDADNDGITDTEEAKTLATLGLKDAAATDANASKSKVQLAEEAKQAYEDYLTKAQQAGGDAPNDKATLNAEELEKLAELKSDLDAKLKSAEDAVEGLAGKLGGSDVDTNTTEKGLKDRLEALKTVSEIPEGAKDADNDGKTDADEKALVDAFINGTDDANDAEVGLEAVKKARDEYQRALDSARDATGTNKPTITPTEAKALADAKKALDKAIEDAEAKLDDLKAELGNTDADSKKVAELKALLDAQKVAEADVPKADDADNDGITDTEEAKTLATLGLKDAAATDANASKSKVQLAEEAKQAYEDYLTKAQQAGGDAPNDKATLNAEELEKLAELKSDLDAKLKSAEDAVEGLAGKLGGSDVDTNTTEKGLKDRLEALKTVSEIPEGAKDADNDGKTDADEKALVDAFINGTDDANDAEVGLEAVKKARDEYQRALDSARDATGTNKPTITPTEAKALADAKKALDKAIEDAEAKLDDLKAELGNTDADSKKVAELKALLDAQKVAEADVPKADDADNDGITDTEEAKTLATLGLKDAAATDANASKSKVQLAEEAKQAYEDYLTKAQQAGGDAPNDKATLNAEELEKLAELKSDLDAKLKSAEDAVEGLAGKLGGSDVDTNTTEKGLKDRLEALKTVSEIPEGAKDADNDGKTDADEKALVDAFINGTDDANDAEVGLEAVKKARDEYQRALDSARDATGTNKPTITPTEAKALADAKKALDKAIEDAEAKLDDLKAELGNTDADSKKVAELKALLDAQKVAEADVPKADDADNDGITDTEEAKTLATLGLKDAAATDANASKSKVQLAEEAKQAYEDYLTKAQQAGGDAPNDKATLNAEELEKLAELKSDLDAKLKSAEDAVEGLAGKLGGSDVDTNTTEKGLKDRLEALKTVSEIPEGAKDADNDGKTDADEKALVDAFINGTDDANDAEVGLEAVKKARDEYQRALDSARDATGTNKPTITPTEAKALADAKKALDKAIEDAEAKLDDLKAELGNTDADSKKVAELKALLDAQKVAEADVPKADDADNDGITDTEEAKTLATLGLKDAAATDANASKSKVQLAEEAKQAYEDYLTKAQQAGGTAPNDKATLNAEELEKLAELKADLDAKLKSAQDAVNGLAEKLGGTTADGTKQTGFENRLAEAGKVTPIPEGAKDADNDGIPDVTETQKLSDAEAKVVAAEKARKAYDEYLIKAQTAGKNAPNDKATINKAEAEELAKLKQTLDDALGEANTALTNLATDLGNQPNDTSSVKALSDRLSPLPVTLTTANDYDGDGQIDTDEKADLESKISDLKIAKTAYETALEGLKADGVLTNDEIASLADKKQAFETAKAAANTRAKEMAAAIGDQQHQSAKVTEIGNITITDVKALDTPQAVNDAGSVEFALPDENSKAVKLRIRYFSEEKIRYVNEAYAVGVERELVVVRDNPQSAWKIESTEGTQIKSLNGGNVYAWSYRENDWVLEANKVDRPDNARSTGTKNMTAIGDSNKNLLKAAIFINEDNKLVIPKSEIKSGTEMSIKVESANSEQVNYIDGLRAEADAFEEQGRADPTIINPVSSANTSGAEIVIRGNTLVVKNTANNQFRNIGFSMKLANSDVYQEFYYHRSSLGNAHQKALGVIQDPAVLPHVKNTWYAHGENAIAGQGFANYVRGDGGTYKKLDIAGPITGTTDGTELSVDLTQLASGSKLQVLSVTGFNNIAIAVAEVDVTAKSVKLYRDGERFEFTDDNKTLLYVSSVKVSEVGLMKAGEVGSKTILTKFGDTLEADVVATRSIDGGEGIDTLKVTTTDALDLGKFSNFEIIDLSASTNQVFTGIDATNLAKNARAIDNVTGLSDVKGLIINGSAGDIVDVDKDNATQGLVTYNSKQYNYYTLGENTVLIQDGITVI